MRRDEGFRNRRRLGPREGVGNARRGAGVGDQVFGVPAAADNTEHAIALTPLEHLVAERRDLPCELEAGDVGWCASGRRILPLPL